MGATTYNLTNDLPEASEIFVTVVPYNSVGRATGCTEESFTTETTTMPPTPTIPDCTTISNPIAGAIDVPVTTDISWNVISDADGYYLTVGTSSGANDILNDFQIVAATTYNLTNDLPIASQIFVTVVPYNSVGRSTGCTEESFATETTTMPPTPTIPDCTTISNPIAGAVDVSVTTDISWNAVPDADGYYLTVGTSSGANDILNDFQVVAATTYNLTNDLPEASEIFVTVVPYNSIGRATGCAEESFSTEVLATVPTCTNLTSPTNGETQVATDILLAWEEVPNAEGYLLSVGTSENTSDVLAVTDVGMLTEYVLPENLPEGRTIFVSIIAYNALGTSLDCQVQSFTTITQDDTQYGFSPNDDGINDFWTIDGIESVLDNTVQIYNRWGDLVFQIKGYDNASNVFSGTANMKTGMGADQLPSGTYFFNIQVSGEHQLKKLQGFLVLKR